MTIYNIMFDKLQGFKQFFAEGELAPVNPEVGHAELGRLDRGHYFFVLPVDHKLAGYFMKGHLTGADFVKSKSVFAADIVKEVTRLTPEKDTLLIISVPKRWEKQLGRGGNIQETFGKMIGMSGESARHVWGAYSLYNPRTEDLDTGHFYRNPLYHANDDILDGWLKDHPSPIKEKPAVPLDRQPRLMGQHLLDQGRKAFHGYTEPTAI